ncbi:hypothetical protein SeLEV6574_g04511 [Synchytrium endobioticum]|uniref:Uncharacterized protein n=1 Tax=Synchytrium endobioticum TaxID=286115 RepID=A0A507CZ37_9FUNG|nr:hypothetical protein SeLEV6574_g04511 [Synchytrium endobioticum]
MDPSQDTEKLIEGLLEDFELFPQKERRKLEKAWDDMQKALPRRGSFYDINPNDEIDPLASQIEKSLPHKPRKGGEADDDDNDEEEEEKDWTDIYNSVQILRTRMKETFGEFSRQAAILEGLPRKAAVRELERSRHPSPPTSTDGGQSFSPPSLSSIDSKPLLQKSRENDYGELGAKIRKMTRTTEESNSKETSDFNASRPKRQRKSAAPRSQSRTPSIISSTLQSSPEFGKFYDQWKNQATTYNLYPDDDGDEIKQFRDLGDSRKCVLLVEAWRNELKQSILQNLRYVFAIKEGEDVATVCENTLGEAVCLRSPTVGRALYKMFMEPGYTSRWTWTEYTIPAFAMAIAILHVSSPLREACSGVIRKEYSYALAKLGTYRRKFQAKSRAIFRNLWNFGQSETTNILSTESTCGKQQQSADTPSTHPLSCSSTSWKVKHKLDCHDDNEIIIVDEFLGSAFGFFEKRDFSFGDDVFNTEEELEKLRAQGTNSASLLTKRNTKSGSNSRSRKFRKY